MGVITQLHHAPDTTPFYLELVHSKFVTRTRGADDTSQSSALPLQEQAWCTLAARQEEILQRVLSLHSRLDGFQ